MAEKPKLKETDEIMSSIGKKNRQPTLLSADLPDEEERGPVQSSLNSAAVPGARRRRRAAEQQEPPQEPMDRNPLDIGKYDLKRPAAKRAAGTGGRIVEPIPPEEPVEEVPVEAYEFEDFAQEPAPAAQPQSQPEPLPQPAAREPEPEPPVQADAEQAAPAEPSAPKKRGRPRKAESNKSAQAARAVEMQLQNTATESEEEEAPKRKRGRPRKNPLPQPEAEQAEQAAQEPQAQEEPPSLLPPEKDPNEMRQSFRKLLANRFDEEFAQRFESSGEPRKKKKGQTPPVIENSWFEPEKGKPEALLPPEAEQEVVQEAEHFLQAFEQKVMEEELAISEEEEILREDLEVAAGTNQFLQEFEQKVMEEEISKTESFKETLAQKFMRERERYLKELGVIEDEEQPAQDQNTAEAAAPERRLDLKIQPEMHTGAAPAKPVTYGPGGAVRPMEDPDDEGEALPYMLPVGERAAARGYHKPAPGTTAAAQAAQSKIHTQAPGGKKTPEELLMELSVQNAMRGRQPLSPHQLTPEERKRQAALLRKQSLLSFALKGGKALPPEGEGQRKRKRNLAIAAAVLAVVLVAVFSPLSQVLSSWQKQEQPDIELDAGLTLTDDTMTVYESHNPEARTDVGDILVKRGGISLSNYNVGNHIIIGDIESQSDVLLRDMTVGGTIYVQSCGVNLLRLEDVTADRVVINNTDQRVTVQVGGDSSVGVVEVRTPGTVVQGELAEDAPGVSAVQAKQESMGILDVTVDGARLNSMTTSGSTIVTLAGNSSVELMATEGTLNLAGNGRVFNLSASGLDGEEISMSIKDVPVMALTLNGAAQASVSSQVDSMTISDALMLSGSGNVSMLRVNRGMSDKRITVDLVGAQVNTLIADTEVLVNSDGDNRIGMLTANESVYTLGNPVGQLAVNHDRVIYENEPDKVVVKSGVRPPESVADNPNVDFTLSTRQGSGLADASGDEVGTTCTHTRENGGFVYGDGSRSDPFQVSTPAQLAHVAQHLESHYVQTADIDLSEDSQFASGFTPIAIDGKPFSGSYDGGGYSIAGLRINGNWENTGLFAENIGTVKNVHISGGEVRSTAAATAHVGAVVGFNYSGGVVEACSNGARVLGAASGNAGGVVGYNFGAKIRDSYNYAKISGGGSVGGVAGANRENASIVGSYNVGTIENAVNTGAVVGSNTGGTIVNCYYLADTAEHGVGDGTGSAEQRTHTQMTRTQFARDLAAGDEDTLWRMPDSGSYDYPVLGKPAEAGLVYTQPTTPGEELGDDDEEIPVDEAPMEVDETVA